MYFHSKWRKIGVENSRNWRRKPALKKSHTSNFLENELSQKCRFLLEGKHF